MHILSIDVHVPLRVHFTAFYCIFLMLFWNGWVYFYSITDGLNRLPRWNLLKPAMAPPFSVHPAAPALQLIGGVGGWVCRENLVNGTQPSDVNGDCWRGKHVNGEGRDLKQLQPPPKYREGGRERIGIPKEAGKRNSSSDATSAETEVCVRLRDFNVHEEKKGGIPPLN